jgi:hypothetical protein
MLDAFIIDQIRKREEERRREEQERPVVQIPLPPPERDKPERPDNDDAEDKSPRGVIIIDLAGP